MEEKNTVSGLAAVIFDLDGTLLYTLADIARAANHALQINGFPTHPTEDYRTWVGWGLLEIVRRAIPEDVCEEETLQRVYTSLMKEYRRDPIMHTVPYPGIDTLLDTITQKGIPMGVLSNKEEPLVVRIVEQLLDSWEFIDVRGNREDRPKKPDPAVVLEIADKMAVAPEKIAYVGDSDIDMKTAVNAGMLPVGVVWGYMTKDVLHNAGAQFLARRADELLKLFS